MNMENAAMISADSRETRILLVLDNPDGTRNPLAHCEDAGYPLDCMASGAGAVEAVRHTGYGLVLMAIETSAPDGLETSRHIRELPGDRGLVPIVALGTGSEPDRQEACLAAGIDLCLADMPGQLSGLLDSWLQDPATLDMKVLERLESDTSPEAMPRLLATFRRETARRVAAVSLLRSTQDLHALQREAHSLKSSAGTFGATSLQHLARQLESTSRDGAVEPAVELATTIVAHWPRVVRALARYPDER
jgi:CheY-like chemotaxis protein